MAYLALDNSMPQHPKIMPLTDAAFRLYVSGLAYCSAFLTDGQIPAGVLTTLVPRYRVRSRDELLTAGLWVRYDNPIVGYQVRDYLEWNRSREQVEKQRAAGVTGARARWHGRINGERVT